MKAPWPCFRTARYQFQNKSRCCWITNEINDGEEKKEVLSTRLKDLAASMQDLYTARQSWAERNTGTIYANLLGQTITTTKMKTRMFRAVLDWWSYLAGMNAALAALSSPVNFEISLFFFLGVTVYLSAAPRIVIM